MATSLVVREDSLTLFGFATDDERNVFELLQTASGIGPRLALAMLAVHSPDALRRAVAAEDVKALTMVPGIGNKGAQRIILELKDRLGAPSDTGRRHRRRARPAGPRRPGAIRSRPAWSTSAGPPATPRPRSPPSRPSADGGHGARRGHRAARRAAEAVQV